jgi:flavin-dependent dehydrogenase
MANHYQILIIGGGNAGLSVASQLLHKRSTLKIAIVDPSEKHYYQPAWTLVGAGVFDINKTVRNEKDFIPKNTTWIKDAVSEYFPLNFEFNNCNIWLSVLGIVPVAAKPASAPKTPSMGSVGGVKFERRAATRAELDAARAAREAAKGAGKSKSEQELSAVKAGVEASKVKKEEYDAYDLVLEYLLSQGHVETVEEALYVMMEMDAEVIQDIVSEQSNTLLTPEQRRADELKYGAKRTTQVPPARPSGMKAKPGSRMPL